MTDKISLIILLCFVIMDKTIINILTILISGSGFFMALTKFNVPQLHQTFLGSNPFSIKRDRIDGVMTWVFTLMALSGLVLQLSTEIWGENLQQRIHTQCFYINFTAIATLGVSFTLFVLTKIGFCIARKILRPIIVESQKELFAIASFVVKNDGWKKGQLLHKDTYKNPETYKEENYADATKYVEQIESLLDISNKNMSLDQRVEELYPYFSEIKET